MKQKLSKRLSILPNTPERVILTFRLCKAKDETYGFTIVGGNCNILDGIYIKTIIEGQFAHRDGRLQKGDQIISVNNRSFLDISHEDAVAYITRNDKMLDLIVSRMIDTSTGLDQRTRKLSQVHLQFISYNSEMSDEEPDVLEVKSLS